MCAILISKAVMLARVNEGSHTFIHKWNRYPKHVGLYENLNIPIANKSVRVRTHDMIGLFYHALTNQRQAAHVYSMGIG